MGRGTSKAGGGTTVISNVPVNPVALTDSEAQQLRDQQDSMYDANTTSAVKMYISNTDFDKQGHSLSQCMNFLEDNGVDLATADVNTINKQYGLRLTANDLASLQYTSAYMDVAVHPLGKSVQLQRGAHDDLLKNTFGIQDYSKMSQQQLQDALVGQCFQSKSNMSTSYDVNKNPFLGKGSGVSGGRELILNINAGANSKVLFGAKAQSEIIMGKSNNYKITGVRYNGNYATPRGKYTSMPQLEIDIDTF